MENFECKILKFLALDKVQKEQIQKDKIESITHNLEKYKKILMMTKILSDELKLKNSLEAANLYTYLLWNGYFSKEQSLRYQNAGKMCIPGMYSQDIMNGIGTCLNFADMLTDFLNEFEFSCATMITNPDKNFKYGYDVNIDRRGTKTSVINKNKSHKSIFQNNTFRKFVGKHAFNLIKENNKFYIYDSTNLTAFNINDKKNAVAISGSGCSYLKPYTSYGYNFTDKSINTLYDFDKTKIFDIAYNEQNFIDSWEKCFELLSDNKKLLIDFYSQIKEDIIKISKTNDRCYLDIQDVIREKVR